MSVAALTADLPSFGHQGVRRTLVLSYDQLAVIGGGVLGWRVGVASTGSTRIARRPDVATSLSAATSVEVDPAAGSPNNSPR